MMIAFITVNSSLVPFIEGLCSSNPCEFEFWVLDGNEKVFTFTSLAFLFRKEKRVTEREQLVQDLTPPPSTYVHMCTLYTCTNTYMPRFTTSEFFGPSRCLVPIPGLTSEYPMHSVCVCVCTHIHSHTLPPASKNREDTDNTPMSPFCQKWPHMSSYKCSDILAQPPHPHSSTLMKKLQTRMCTPCIIAGQEMGFTAMLHASPAPWDSAWRVWPTRPRWSKAWTATTLSSSSPLPRPLGWDRFHAWFTFMVAEWRCWPRLPVTSTTLTSGTVLRWPASSLPKWRFCCCPPVKKIWKVLISSSYDSQTGSSTCAEINIPTIPWR